MNVGEEDEEWYDCPGAKRITGESVLLEFRGLIWKSLQASSCSVYFFDFLIKSGLYVGAV